MGAFARAAAVLEKPARAIEKNPITSLAPLWQQAASATKEAASYAAAARAYSGNELIFRAIELRADSAAEPQIKARRTVPERQRRQLRVALKQAGASDLIADYYTSAKALSEVVTDHPAVQLLSNPNPFMSRFDFWATVNMHRDLAGNAYAWKRRDLAGDPRQLWLLRPDRVKVRPGGEFIDGYRYSIGGDYVDLPAADVIQFKTRHPYNEYYGMPPLMPLSGRVSIDNYMEEFVLAAFTNGGNPGAVLSVKNKLSAAAKEELREHFHMFSGPGGWFELMVLEEADATYTPMTMQLGQRGLVIPELNNIDEARIFMAFGIPLSIAGAVLGQEGAAYANKKQDWQVLWDLTFRAIYMDHQETLNLSLKPDYPDIDELFWDLSTVQALQEDEDKKHARARANYDSEIWSMEEARVVTGMQPVPAPGDHFKLGIRETIIEAPLPGGAEEPPAVAPPAPAPAALAAPRRGGRPRLEEDRAARELYLKGEQLRRANRSMTIAQAAARIGVSEPTYKRWRQRFGYVPGD